jgi:uncharacterized protein
MGKCTEQPPEQLLLAVKQFNEGEWFECHETLEDIWMSEDGESRDLYQGILQISVAMHHWKNGNFGGTISLLTSGVDLLRHLNPVCQQVDVAMLVESAESVQKVLSQLGKTRMAELDRALIPHVRVICGSEDSDERKSGAY